MPIIHLQYEIRRIVITNTATYFELHVAMFISILITSFGHIPTSAERHKSLF